MLKYASAQIMTKALVPQDASARDLRRFAHRHHFDYQVRPGYLYVRSRAISSRCNDNYDSFPAEELEKAYTTFKGKPVFVNHHNDNHKRARGVIIDAALHKDANRDGTKDYWVEVLMEIDALRFPKLAAEIMNGNIARTSMGCDVAFSVCSACGNRATTPAEYCTHIPASKGVTLYRTTASGHKIGEIIRETCYGLRFFENSLLVEPPADPTAFFLGVDARGLDRTASKTAAHAYSWDEIGQMHPHVYGEEGGDSWGIGDAANHLAHDREEDPEAEGSDVSQMSFHFKRVKPSQIDHQRHESYDGRVQHAAQGYRNSPDAVPPLVLVHRHGVYQVADGHHRAAGAKVAGVSSVPAYVAYSPHEDEPFSDGSSAPFHGAAKSPATPPGRKPVDYNGPGHEQGALFEAKRVALADLMAEGVKDPRFAEVGLKQDEDGHYVTTHRARSDSYPSPEDIPQDVVDRIAATGAAATPPEDHPWFKETGLSHHHIVDHWDASTDEEKAQGKRWYPDAHLVAKSIAKLDPRITDDKEAAHKGAGVLSAYSPQQGWWANQHNAARAFHEQRAVGKGEGIMVMSSHANAAQKILDGMPHNEALKGPKTQDFASLIETGGHKPQSEEDAAAGKPKEHLDKVVVDRHALSVAAGRRLNADDVKGFPSQSRKHYEVVADHYRKAAAVISDREGREVPPHEVQAVTWLARQRLNAEGDASPGQKGRNTVQRNQRKTWQDLSREHTPELHDSDPPNSHVAAHDDAPYCALCGGKIQSARSIDSSLPAGWTHVEQPGVWTHPTSSDLRPPVAPTGSGDDWKYHGSEQSDEDHPPIPHDNRTLEQEEARTSRQHGDLLRSLQEENRTNKAFDEMTRNFHGSRKLAYGETKAPQDVDTLREDACPVCGDRDTFDGATCQVCGYVAPPKMFQDPDLEKARQMDLRKDIADFQDPANPNQIGPDGQPLQDPADLDENGNPVNPDAADPDAQPGTLPGEVQAEVQPGGDPVGGGSPLDPAALGPDGQPQDPNELGAPVDPAMLGPDGQPLQQPGQQQMVGPDGMPIGPQALPPGATTDDGKPFTPGPNMPQGPGEPEGPEGPAGPQDLDEDGQLPDPDAGQGVPGTPGDGVPDLQCPACGFQADATPPVSVDMDTATMPPTGEATPDGVQAGDVCPNCGAAQLMSPAEEQGQTPVPMPV